MSSPVYDAGRALPKAVWQRALSCGDMLDRLPCERCKATQLSGCRSGMSDAEIDAARDFINGYGWAAARAMGEPTA